MEELKQRIAKIAYRIAWDALEGKSNKTGGDYADEIMSLIEPHTNEAKYGIVINTLNLLNTEPIHTVEQALLGDKVRLESTIDKDTKE